MKNYLYYVDIDISKLKLDISILKSTNERSPEHFLVPNTPKGIKRFVESFKQTGHL